ncbi:hypothetical protein LQW54_004939 [Pestalotiopsis sp. IQ-011]
MPRTITPYSPSNAKVSYAILHELFHLDSLSSRASTGHIEDIGIRYPRNGYSTVRKHQAYGPVVTKVLALWPDDDVGQYIARNADSLAQYALEMWVGAQLKAYPLLPRPDGTPSDTTYKPSFFNDTDATADDTFTGYIEDDVDELGIVVTDASESAGADVLLAADTETYLDCNNNGNLEWIIFSVADSDRELILAAILKQDDTACSSLDVSATDCNNYLGQLVSGCDTGSTTQKYGGVYHTECTDWVAAVNGTQGAVKNSDVDFSCSVLVTADAINCACTDGEIYPTLNETCPYTSSPAGTTTGGGGQQIGIAAYISPVGSPDAWSQTIGYASNDVSILIANVLNGPDNTIDTTWQSVIQKAAASGKRVIGYVRTGYLGLSADGFTTRLGSNALADWVSQIETDVDLWYSMYGADVIGGIFFDEGWNQCGTNNEYSELYRLITENTKRKYPGALTVLNPGSTMPQCFESSADTLLTFESSYDTYLNGFVDNGWVAENTAKIWHIIYNVPQADVAAVAALSLERGAGIIQITDDTLPNPYDTIPDDVYMQQLISAISGSTPGISEPEAYPGGSAAAAPTGLQVTAYDYSSVSLSWSASANAISYKVYLKNEWALNLASYMTSVTIGNLAVGTSGFTFQVTAVGGDGTESAKSNTVTATTLSAPGTDKYILGATVTPSATNTIVTTDVIIPYAYVRVYFTYTIDGQCDQSGWTINYDTTHSVCALWMVESGIIYKYADDYLNQVGTTIPVPSWSWTSVGPVTVTQDKYNYTFDIPLDTSTLGSNLAIVIQTQGYGPLLNYMTPCPLFATDDTYCAN